MRKQKGFSLIELLIVVAIILIIAAIAVPNLLKSKMAANEASAAAALRTIGTAQVTYSSTYNQGFAGTLLQLGPTAGACTAVNSACADLIDSVLSGAGTNGVGAITPPAPTVKSGYTFTYATVNAAPAPASPNATYSIEATPISGGSSGQSQFCMDQTNVVRKDPSPAAVTTPDAGPAAGGCLTFAGNPM
jgi:type IV pilus assembly protein PilA